MTTRSDRHSLPAAILSQHIAVLGKTGSGKTSTAKLAIEQVVADGARVCVLDPIKSDWWGLTSSANGKHAGLPFHILGGPHGHVPLHSAAGKAIADVVATGALPLSIVDMADFEPGGQARFFVDFAPTLLRKMRGVVYLVIEEAHLFAPKERSGIGAENLSIHWAKTMATAGRSKGVRLVLVTQRTQALHNALLGSCDTLIAHRLTAPADQDPVVKWLKANTSKDVLEQVSTSLSSLKTGEGWICSGEAKLFERVHFPRISTYDNTATPTGDGDTREIKTAAVDQEKLRAIIGDAVDAAKADDSRELRKQIAELKKQVASGSSTSNEKPKPEVTPVLTDSERELLGRLSKQFNLTVEAIADKADQVLSGIAERARAEISATFTTWERIAAKAREEFLEGLGKVRVQKILDKLATVSVSTPIQPPSDHRNVSAPRSPQTRRVDRALPPSTRSTPARLVSDSNGELSLGRDNAQSRILAVIKQYPGAEARRVGALAGVSPRLSTYRVAIGALRGAGLIEGDRSGYRLTADGERAAAEIPHPPTGAEAVDHWRRELGDGAPRLIFDALITASENGLSASGLQAETGIDPSVSTFRVAIGKLRNLELIGGDRKRFFANPDLLS